MQKTNKNTQNRQLGFAMIEVIIVSLVLVAVIGIGVWKIFGGQNGQEQNNKQAAKLNSGPLTPEDQTHIEEAQKEAAQNSNEQRAEGTTPSSTPSSATSGQRNSTASASPSSSANTPASSSNTNAQPASPYTRPDTTFCQQKDGDTFTNAWTTDNSTHTYKVWENGGWVNKTSTGTAALNADSMQVVGTIPYLQQAAWAACAEKVGYIMFYYQPPESVYTYNWLVPFAHITIVKP